ncbi:jg4104 [Pararge aegeria aegeria]|uniref:Jg4104 protein n=1 Tax=Pararge aegeria aegeria TaxID=348720 RepID=A0A8S4RZI7_9NEOP|nr:jg4104 [Pararge aegeria aegeria]
MRQLSTSPGGRGVQNAQPGEHIAHHGPAQPLGAQGHHYQPALRALARDAGLVGQDEDGGEASAGAAAVLQSRLVFYLHGRKFPGERRCNLHPLGNPTENVTIGNVILENVVIILSYTVLASESIIESPLNTTIWPKKIGCL